MVCMEICLMVLMEILDFLDIRRIFMTIEDIKALIASDESRTLELKKSTSELKDGMHAACAFLNTADIKIT